MCATKYRMEKNVSTTESSKRSHLSVLREADLIVDRNDDVIATWIGEEFDSDDEQVFSERMKLRKVDRNSICGT